MCKFFGHDYYAFDNAYIGRDYYYRITKNGFQQTKAIDRPGDRFQKLNVTIKPWRKGGSRIVICEQSRWHYEYFGLPQNWAGQTERKLKQFTDRKIKRREKPPIGAEANFIESLKDVYAIVTHSSACAIEAILHGIPAFVLGPSAALPVALADLSKIEEPLYADNREQWAYNLAYCQFNEWDVLTGKAKAYVDEQPAETEEI